MARHRRRFPTNVVQALAHRNALRRGLLTKTNSVTYGYDGAGRNNSRIDANGTTTYNYDQFGRLLNRANTEASQV